MLFVILSDKKIKPRLRRRIQNPKINPVTAALPHDHKNRTFIKSRKSKKITDTKAMRLKTIFLRTTSPGSSSLIANAVPATSDICTPKFANVNPSQILQTLFQQEIIPWPIRKPMALVFTNNHSVQDSNYVANYRYRYCLEKKKKDLSYLCKKYGLLDFNTLDNCYGKVDTFKKVF